MVAETKIRPTLYTYEVNSNLVHAVVHTTVPQTMSLVDLSCNKIHVIGSFMHVHIKLMCDDGLNKKTIKQNDRKRAKSLK